MPQLVLSFPLAPYYECTMWDYNRTDIKCTSPFFPSLPSLSLPRTQSWRRHFSFKKTRTMTSPSSPPPSNMAEAGKLLHIRFQEVHTLQYIQEYALGCTAYPKSMHLGALDIHQEYALGCTTYHLGALQEYALGCTTYPTVV